MASQLAMFAEPPKPPTRAVVLSDLRALTLHRPWDQAIVHGSKRIENRPWKPWASIVGKFIAIHAGLKYDEQGADEMVMLRLFDPPGKTSSPCGAIVGLARVADHVTCSEDPWFVGPFGWILDDVVAVPEPVQCKGAQGLWRVPVDAERAVMAQVKPLKEFSYRGGS